MIHLSEGTSYSAPRLRQAFGGRREALCPSYCPWGPSWLIIFQLMRRPRTGGAMEQAT